MQQKSKMQEETLAMGDIFEKINNSSIVILVLQNAMKTKMPLRTINIITKGGMEIKQYEIKFKCIQFDNLVK